MPLRPHPDIGGEAGRQSRLIRRQAILWKCRWESGYITVNPEDLALREDKMKNTTLAEVCLR